MTRSSSQHQSRRSAALKLVTALAIATVAGSCDKADMAQKSIDAANVKMESLAAAGSNVVAPAAMRKDAFNKIATELKPIADSGESSQTQAANVLLARAKGGLGEISSKDAAELEYQFLSQITIARAQLNQWISQQSTAASLNAYDPAKDLADLDKQAAAKFAEAGRYQADKAKQEAVVAEISGRAAQARTAAKVERDREAGIRKQAEGMSQTAKEQMITQAAAASRAADGLERQAAELSAEAAKEAPKVDEIANMVDRLQKQVESLKGAKESIQKRAAAAKTHSEQAIGDANTVGAKIKTTLDGLAKIREAAATPAQEAVKQYKAASDASRKAAGTPVREAKTAAMAAQGGYQQCIGDVLATKARSVAVYAATLNAIATATPAIPGVPDAAAKAKAAEAEFDSISKEAEAAYTEARGAFDKTGAAGDLKNRMDAVTKAIDELKDLRSKPAGTLAPAPATEKPVDAKPADAKPAADAGVAPDAATKPALSADDAKAVEGEVRAAIKEIAAASAADDTAKLLSHFDFANDAEKKVIEAALPLKKTITALDAAAQAKYGKPIGDLAKESKSPAIKGNPVLPMLVAMGKSNAFAALNSDGDTVIVKATSATEATVSADGSPAVTKMVKKDGAWKITGLGSAMGPMAAQMMPMFKSLSDSFVAVTDSITQDKYADADAMLTDLSAKLMGAMMGGGAPAAPGSRPKPGG